MDDKIMWDRECDIIMDSMNQNNEKEIAMNKDVSYRI